MSVVYWVIEMMWHTDYGKIMEMDSDYIEKYWGFRTNYNALEISAGVLNALAWFIFTIPLMQLSWILSLGGKRGIWIHVTIIAMAATACFTEFVSRIFFIGISGVTEWMSRTVNLDDWGSSGNGLGWKVLELSHMINHGMVFWVDAFETLIMFCILTLIYFSSRGLMCSPNYRPSFTLGRCWAHLGLFIGLLSLIDFAANILRFEALGFRNVYIFISIFNRTLLFPWWLVLMGLNLAKAAKSSEITRMYDNPSANEVNSEPVPVFTPAPAQA